MTARIVSTLIIAIFVAFGLHNGLPLLRHDWGLPSFPDGWRTFGISMISGWDSTGIGEPRAYPTWFIVGPVLAIIGSTLGSAPALFVLILAIAATAVAGAVRLGNQLCDSRWAGCALACCLLFSPWTYEKLVAGHLTMLLSVAVCLYLASELVSGRPRRWVLVLCGFVAAFQIQYAVLVIPFALLLRFEWETGIAVSLGSFLGSLPSFCGIVLARDYLLKVPYNLPWQLNNSVPIAQGVLLDGYAPGYTGQISLPLRIGIALILAAAAVGIVSAFRVNRWRTMRMSGAAAILVLYAAGLRGPISQLYLASLAFRPMLVFRELYDLLGLALVLYLVLAASGSRGSKLTTPMCSIAAVLMLASWCVSPPWRWWIPSADVPHVAVDTGMTNTRFALLPWQQPLKFHGKGSGPDPDLFAHENGVTPVNEYQYDFPSDAALATYARSGDTRGLAALSVSHIYSRPYFTSDLKSINDAFPGEGLPSARSAARDRTLHPQPELELIEPPPVVDTLKPVYELYLFDGGDPVRIGHDVEVVKAADRADQVMDPNRGWAQIQTSGSEFPDAANSFGGVITVRASAILRVPSWRPTAALALVSGKLISGSHTLTSSTGGWHWVQLHGATSLRCSGRCAISLWKHADLLSQSSRPGEPSIPDTPIRFRQITPFLIRGTLPATSGRERHMLLFRSRYDSSWKLFGLSSERHVVVSTVFNGYELARPTHETTFFLVETTAVIQLVAMILSVTGLAFALTVLLRADLRRERSTVTP